jgi:hypothetical protein
LRATFDPTPGLDDGDWCLEKDVSNKTRAGHLLPCTMEGTWINVKYFFPVSSYLDPCSHILQGFLYSGSFDATIIKWGLTNFDPLDTYRGHTEGMAQCISSSPAYIFDSCKVLSVRFSCLWDPWGRRFLDIRFQRFDCSHLE